jgi:hypothetical protein
MLLLMVVVVEVVPVLLDKINNQVLSVVPVVLVFLQILMVQL